MNHNNNVSDWVNIVERDVDHDKNIKLYVNSLFVQSDIFCRVIDNNSEKKSNTINEINKLPDILEIKAEINGMTSDHNGMSDIIILEKTSSYTKKIKNLFNKKIEYCDDLFITWFTESLELLRDVMFELSNRNSQSINTLNQEKKQQQDKKISISRNSYKFCEYGYGCKYNYEIKQICHAHHFVFNLVYMDIIDILEYISTIFSCNSKITIVEIEEIRTSVNTITYVLNHMHDELSQLKTTRPECYQNYVNRKYDLNSVFSKRPFKKKIIIL